MSTPPTSLEDIKASWLEKVLGITCLEQFTITSPKDLIGYASDIGFLNISGSESNFPTDFFIKVPPKERARREAVINFGGFEREVMFYRYLAPILPIRSPRPYATEIEINTGSGILVLEDCSKMKRFRFDEVPPLTSELEQIVRTLARLHAFWWNQTDSLTKTLPGFGSASNWKCPKEITTRKWLESSLPKKLPDDMVKLATRLSKKISGFRNDASYKKNTTLAHMDFHLQNILYDPDDENDPVVILDWDSFGIGCGAHDLAYMASLLPIEYRRLHEDLLLKEYLEQLITRGVTDYSASDLYSDYQVGCLLAPSLQTVLARLMDNNPEDQRILCDLAKRQFQLVLDNQAETLVK